MTQPIAQTVVMWVFQDPSPTDVGIVRRGVKDVMKRRRWDRPDFLLAVSELVTNAVKYSDFVLVTLRCFETRLSLSVFDDNVGFELRMPSEEEILDILSGEGQYAERGRGLLIVKRTSDEVSIRNRIIVLGVPGKEVTASLTRKAA